MNQRTQFNTKQDVLNALDEYQDSAMHECAMKAVISEDPLEISTLYFANTIYPSNNTDETYGILEILYTYLSENTSLDIDAHHEMLAESNIW